MLKRSLLTFIILLGAVAVGAEVPKTINFQGRLTDSGGVPVADSAYNVSIRIYATAGAPVGSHLWADTYDIQTRNGYFEVALGSQVPFPDTGPGAMDFNQQYFVGVKVGADEEMTPRQALQSVPYAVNADALDGYDNSAFIKKNAAMVEAADIAIGAVDGQNKAPWAPVVSANGLTLSQPKIIGGQATTDTAGWEAVNISSFGFSARPPIIIATALDSDPNPVVMTVADESTSTMLYFRSWYQVGDGHQALGSRVFYWLAIGN